MLKNQKYIYYICGQQKSVVSNSPLVAKVQQCGCEVLYLLNVLEGNVAELLNGKIKIMYTVL